MVQCECQSGLPHAHQRYGCSGGPLPTHCELSRRFELPKCCGLSLHAMVWHCYASLSHCGYGLELPLPSRCDRVCCQR